MNCTSFMKHASALKSNETQMRDFENTREFRQLMDNVFEKLGLNRSTIFGVRTVLAMWYQCTFTQAAHIDKLSPWCSVRNIFKIEIFKKKG